VRPFLIPFVGLFGSACLFASDEEVERLEARVAALEAQAAAQAGASEPRVPGTGAAGPQKERPGERLLEEGRAAIDRGDVRAARTRLRECTVLYPESAAARTSLQLLDAIALIGKPVATVPVENWLNQQGSNRLDAPTLIVLWEAQSLDAVRDISQVDRATQAVRKRGTQVLGLVRLANPGAEEAARKVLADTMAGFPVGVESDGARQLFNQTTLPAAIMVRDGAVTWVDHPSRIHQSLARKLAGEQDGEPR